MRLTRYTGIFRHLVILALGFLAFFSASRLLLIAIHWDRVAATDGIEFILLQGLRFDIILIGIVLGPVFLFKSWFHTIASLVFTSSNHEPFGIPENRVKRESDPEAERKTAIRYADYALGRFLDQARQSSYWENTVFLIIADHPARLFAGKLVPVHRFHIPGVIIGDTIQPRRIPGITSQIDFVPTLLSLMGIDSSHPGIGRDLTLPEYRGGSGRAMMQFNALQAYHQ